MKYLLTKPNLSHNKLYKPNIMYVIKHIIYNKNFGEIYIVENELGKIDKVYKSYVYSKCSIFYTPEKIRSLKIKSITKNIDL